MSKLFKISAVLAFFYLPMVVLNEESLHEAARPRLRIGCAVTSTDLKDDRLTALVVKHFNCLTPEYELMPEQALNDERRFTFERIDEVVAFGKVHDMQEKLAERYGEIMRTILKHPEVNMIGFWGTHEGRSWLNNFPVEGRTNHPLLFDRAYTPKPAFNAVREALNAVGGLK